LVGILTHSSSLHTTLSVMMKDWEERTTKLERENEDSKSWKKIQKR
jgi:hypothetical protein